MRRIYPKIRSNFFAQNRMRLERLMEWWRPQPAEYRCPVCGSSAFSAQRPYVARTAGNVFSGRMLTSCAGCGARSVYPMPSSGELRRYYRSYSYSDAGSDEQLPFLEAQAQARVKFMDGLLGDPPALQALDVGAGFGCIARHLGMLCASLAYDAVEWDDESVRRLKQSSHVRAVYHSVDKARGPYGLVVLSHVLEHVPDPGALLRAIRERLLPQGLLLIEVPNEDDRFKESNEPHLCFFAAATLARLVERCGFRVVRQNTFGLPAPQVAQWWRSIAEQKRR